MSDLVTCPECRAEAPPVAWCETCGATWALDSPLSAGLVRSTVEQFLREQGWYQSGPLDPWRGFQWLPGSGDTRFRRTLGEALDVALRNEGGER